MKPGSSAYDDAGWHAVTDHVHADDYLETDSGWRALGHAAGFGRVELLFTGPTDLPRMSCFRASSEATGPDPTIGAPARETAPETGHRR